MQMSFSKNTCSSFVITCVGLLCGLACRGDETLPVADVRIELYHLRAVYNDFDGELAHKHPTGFLRCSVFALTDALKLSHQESLSNLLSHPEQIEELVARQSKERLAKAEKLGLTREEDYPTGFLDTPNLEPISTKTPSLIIFPLRCIEVQQHGEESLSLQEIAYSREEIGATLAVDRVFPFAGGINGQEPSSKPSPLSFLVFVVHACPPGEYSVFCRVQSRQKVTYAPEIEPFPTPLTIREKIVFR